MKFMKKLLADADVFVVNLREQGSEEAWSRLGNHSC